MDLPLHGPLLAIPQAVIGAFAETSPEITFSEKAIAPGPGAQFQFLWGYRGSHFYTSMTPVGRRSVDAQEYVASTWIFAPAVPHRGTSDWHLMDGTLTPASDLARRGTAAEIAGPIIKAAAAFMAARAA